MPLSNAATQSSETPVLRSLPRTAGFADAFGDRQLLFDPAISASLEVLRLKPEFSEVPEFEEALRARVELIGHVQHPSLAVIHSVERTPEAGLCLISRHTPGRRISELLPKAHGPAFALELIRLVTPALASLHRAGQGVVHGALSAERIIVTRDGRLIVAEHVLGSALERLDFSRQQILDHGLIVPPDQEPVRFSARTDLAQLGFIALSLLLGRRLEPSDYPDRIPGLLDEFARIAGSPVVAAKMRVWLERALQLSPRAFASTEDAQAAMGLLPDDQDVQAAAAADAMQSFPAERKAPESSTEVRPAGQRVQVTEFKLHAEPRPPVPFKLSEHKPVEQKLDEHKVAEHGLAERADPVRTEHKPVDHKPAMERPDEGHATASVPASQKPRGRGFSKWIIAALVLVAAGQGAVMYLTPYLRPAAEVIELRPVRTETASVALPPPTPPVAELLQPTPTPGAVTNGVQPIAAATTAAAGAAPVAGASSLAAPAPATPAGPRFGGITVASPLQLQVFEDGKLLGVSGSSIAVGEGSRNLEFVNEQLGFRYRQAVTIRGGQMTNVNIAVPNGRVSINAAPWAEVEINGKAAGETPLANLSLPIGTHEIVFRHPQLGTRKQTVVVKVDGITKVTQVFDQQKD
jgi:hypothetical protein